MRETSKIVTHPVDGKEEKFQIHKMDALEGASLLKFVVEKFVPLFKNAEQIFAEPKEGATEEEVAIQRTEDILDMLPKALEKISDDELIDFEKRCLRKVDMMKPAGWQPVFMGNSFGVKEIEHDVITALLLCYDVVLFNFSGFFEGRGLGSLLNPQTTSP